MSTVLEILSLVFGIEILCSPSAQCLAALKHELNSNANLAMVRGETNLQVRIVLFNIFLAGKNQPGLLILERKDGEWPAGWKEGSFQL